MKYATRLNKSVFQSIHQAHKCQTASWKSKYCDFIDSLLYTAFGFQKHGPELSTDCAHKKAPLVHVIFEMLQLFIYIIPPPKIKCSLFEREISV